jgi:hypothetical protein
MYKMNLKVETNTTIDEIKKGAKVYYGKYRAVRTNILLVIAVIACCANVYMFFSEFQWLYGGFAAACAFIGYKFFSAGKVFVKSIEQKLEGTEPEIQVFKFYGDRFEIETYEQAENAKGKLIAKETVSYSQEICFAEQEQIYVIIVNRRVYYVLPKRCVANDYPELTKLFDK